MSRLKQQQDQQQQQKQHQPEFRIPDVPAITVTTSDQQQRQRSANETTLSETMSSGMDDGGGGGIFAGMSFEIVGFEADEFEDQKFLLIKNGAKVVTFDPDLSNLIATPTSGATTSSKRAIRNKASHFVLLPMISPAPISNPNQVTVYWMVRSFFQDLI